MIGQNLWSISILYSVHTQGFCLCSVDKRFYKLEEGFCDAVVLAEHIEEPALLEHRVLRPILSRLPLLPPQSDCLTLPAEVEERLDGVFEVETLESLGIWVVGEVGNR